MQYPRNFFKKYETWRLEGHTYIYLDLTKDKIKKWRRIDI